MEKCEPACLRRGMLRCLVAALSGVGQRNGKKPTEAVSETTQKVIEEADLPAAAVEAIREGGPCKLRKRRERFTARRNEPPVKNFCARPRSRRGGGGPRPKAAWTDLVAKVLARIEVRRCCRRLRERS